MAVGLKLKEHGHRVRVATHSQLRSFVEQFGLDFYPLGGDPQVLADFAVQSKGAPQNHFDYMHSLLLAQESIVIALRLLHDFMMSTLTWLNTLDRCISPRAWPGSKSAAADKGLCCRAAGSMHRG